MPLPPARAIEPYMEDKLRAAEATFRELQLRMADPDIAANATEFQKVAKAAAELEATVTAYRDHQESGQQLAAAVRYLKEEASSDPDMAEFAREEIAELEARIADLEARLKLLLLPKDPLDDRDIMLEIRCARVFCGWLWQCASWIASF
jgi:peptide chain release factor 1